MELVAFAVSLFFVLALLGLPIFIFKVINTRSKKTGRLLLFLGISILLTSITMFLFAWWSDWSNEWLLGEYGYRTDGMTVEERYENVTEPDRERVKALELSLYGIGWPIKAVLMYLFYLPFLLLIYFLGSRFLSNTDSIPKATAAPTK